MFQFTDTLFINGTYAKGQLLLFFLFLELGCHIALSHSVIPNTLLLSLYHYHQSISIPTGTRAAFVRKQSVLGQSLLGRNKYGFLYVDFDCMMFSFPVRVVEKLYCYEVPSINNLPVLRYVANRNGFLSIRDSIIPPHIKAVTWIIHEPVRLPAAAVRERTDWDILRAFK